MAGEEILGHGKIVVEVDSNVGRELKEVEAQFDRTMAKLDRKEAELRLGADTSEFYAKLRKAQADKERWEHERATATLDVDARKANAGFANATRRLKQYEAENVKLYNRVQQLDEDRALAVERNEKKIAQVRAAQAKKTADAIKKAEQEAVKAAEEAAKKRAAAGEKARAAEIKAEEDKVRAAVAAEKKRALEAEKAERKRVAEAEKAARAEAAAREKAEKAEAAEREKAARAEIAQREKTVKAIRDAEVKAQRAAEQASARRARESEKARRAEVKAEEARVRAAVRASRISEKATSDAEALRARELSTVKRDTVRYLDLLERRQKLVDKRNRVFIDKRQRDKIDLKIDAHTEEIDRLEERLHRLGHPPPKISFDVDERGTKALSRWAAALSDTTVRLGPFTSTIGGAIRALTLLGPVVVGVAGAVLSLGGAIGAGLAGGIGLGSAALAGFVPLIGGTAVALLPVAQNLKAAFAAQKKYNDAVSKYGSKSKQAKTAQDQLNSVFAHMPKQTAEAFKGLERLKKSFQDATKPAANRDFGKVFSEGIKTADKLLPSFAARTRGFMNRAADGISEALQRLRSKGGRDTLNNLFDNANRSLTPLLHGLTSLGAAFGHIASDFSNFLPGLSKGFADWADNVNRASKSVSAKNAVHTMVDGFKALIHITASATRLLATFFGVAAGRGGGIDFLNSIADGMDRISDNIRANPGGLGSFFKDSIKTTQDLYQVLKPLAQVFIEWATIMRPFSDIILNVSATFGRLISDMARFKGVRDLLVGAFGLFLAGTLVSKVLSVVDAVKELGAAIKALGALKVGGAAIDFLSGGAAGNVLGRFRKGKTAVAVGEDAVKAAGGISTVEKAAGAATVGLAAFEGAEVAAGGAAAALGTAGAVAATGGVALLAAGAIYGSYKLLTMKSSSDKLRDSLKHINAQTTDFVARIRASADVVYAAGEAERNYHASLGRVAALKKKLNDLEEHGKKNTAEYRAALERLNTELGQRQKYETEANKFSAAANKFAVDATAHALRGATARGKLNDALKEQAKWQKIVDETGTPEAKQRLRDATNDVAAAQKVYNRELSAENLAQRQAAVNVLNYQRALHGLVELSGDAATSLSKLALKSKSLATKIALKFVDPKDAGAVAGRASAALKSGVKSTIVTHIVADSKSAEEAIRKLGAQVAALRARRAAVSIGLDDQASAKIAHIVSKVNSLPDGRTKVEAIDHATAKIARIISGILHIPNKQANLIAHDLITGKATAATRAIKGIPNKTVTLGVNANLGPLQAAIRLLGGLHDKTITLTTVQNVLKSVKNSRAAGRGPIGRETSLVGEGAGPELVADHKTGRVVKVDRPTFMNLSDSQAVIPTEPRYRARGLGFFKDFARSMGIPMFAGGKGTKFHQPSNRDGIAGPGFYPTMFTPRKPGAYTSGKRKHNIKGAGFGKGLRLNTQSPKAIYVKQLQTKEEDLGKEIDLQERSIKEPDTFLKKSGQKDGLGNDIYVVDNDLVKSYTDKLKTLKSWQQNLQDTIAEEVKYLPLALGELTKARKDSSFNLHALTKEQTRLEKAIENERGKKKPDKAKINAWTKRLKAIKGEVTRETKIHDGSVEDFNNFKARQKDAGFDYRSIGQDISDTQSDIDSVAGKASSEVGSDGTAVGGSGGGGSGGGGGGDGSPGSLSIAKGDAEIAQGVLNGDTALQIKGYNDKIAGFKDEISAANALLSDSLPGNDEEAYNMLAEASSGISEATAAITALQGGGSADSISADAQAQVNQAQTNAATAARAQKIAESMLAVFTGSGDLGRGGYTALGALLSGSGLATPGGSPFGNPLTQALGGNTIIVNTLHPGDTRTLDAIGRAATAGQSLQGYRPTTRFGTGY